ncbi:MAG: hypothetical protein H6728_07910 [Myxococcales bacterium]|nr:hypothetical protein [Myxococcales bacterium]MCB9642982.1 hypothetical protein [Myxococcales bacterium]
MIPKVLTSTAKLFGAGLLFALFLTGCRPPHEAERAFARFRQHIQLQKQEKVWEMLSQNSKKQLQQLLQNQQSPQKAKDFFLKSLVGNSLRMRPHPTFAPQFQKDSAKLFFLDALGQKKIVSLHKEGTEWKIELQGTWSVESSQSAPPKQTSPTSKQTTHPSTTPIPAKR